MKQPAFGLISSYPASTHICKLLPEITDTAVYLLLTEHIIKDDQPVPIVKLPDSFWVKVSGVERLREALRVKWQFVRDGGLRAFLHDNMIKWSDYI